MLPPSHIGGFDLHANVAVPAGDRTRLEHLARYVLRPPIAQDALELTPEGNLLLKIRRPWHDGTCAILFEPYELIARLCSILRTEPRLRSRRATCVLRALPKQRVSTARPVWARSRQRKPV